MKNSKLKVKNGCFGKDLMDLDIDIKKIRNHDDYRKLWKKMGKIELRMVKKNEECPHKVGDTFYYDNPYSKPRGVCNALLHVLDLYTWRVALGFPSWNEKDRKTHLIHCPDARGTVWEMKKVVRKYSSGRR
jgi:uncharacterized repeat protein (TIGR04076 family)